MSYDYLIRNCRWPDFEAGCFQNGDVAVTKSRIAAVSGHLTGDTKQVIEANGRILSPGFIDIHMKGPSAPLRSANICRWCTTPARRTKTPSARTSSSCWRSWSAAIRSSRNTSSAGCSVRRCPAGGRKRAATAVRRTENKLKQGPAKKRAPAFFDRIRRRRGRAR